MRGLSNFIEKKFLKLKKEKEILLKVDGRPIPMTPFVRDFLSKTIKGMLSALKGCEPPESIEIRIEGEEK
jgi:molybdopterin-guanine dinucleotide biosynthesis protein B